MISKPEVWMHKKTGQLWEHFETYLGPAITCVNLGTGAPAFTSWYDWAAKRYFYFCDRPEYNPANFENLGGL